MQVLSDAHVDGSSSGSRWPRLELLDRLFGIPHFSPAEAALFRIVFGTALLCLLAFPSGLGPTGQPTVLLQPGSGYGMGQWGISHWLRATPEAHAAVYTAALMGALGLTVGCLTRLSTVVLWISLFLLICVRLTTGGAHNWGAPLLALAGLALTPLGHAYSIDALARRRIGRGPTAASGPVYGFAVWWIGFVLGLAFLAAAYAKLRVSGLEWLTSGAVGYHFLEDAGNAIVPWGIWIAGRPWLTIMLSAVALLVETALIAVVFCRREEHRLAIGLTGLGLQLGIYLFQGVLWWPWLVLYVSFLPWQRLARLLRMDGRPLVANADRRARLSVMQALAIVLLTVSQIYASAQRLEYEPLVSNYPMYSGTWPSRDAFMASIRWSKLLDYHYAARDDAGGRIDVPDGAGIISSNDQGKVIDLVRALCTGASPPDVEPTMDLIAERLSQRAGRPIDLLEIMVDIREFDFDHMSVVTRTRGLHALTLRLSTPTLEFVAPAFDPPCTQPATQSARH